MKLRGKIYFKYKRVVYYLKNILNGKGKNYISYYEKHKPNGKG